LGGLLTKLLKEVLHILKKISCKNILSSVSVILRKISEEVDPISLIKMWRDLNISELKLSSLTMFPIHFQVFISHLYFKFISFEMFLVLLSICWLDYLLFHSEFFEFFIYSRY
jgi:hypothetical protein